MSLPSFHIQVHRAGGVARLAVHGELDLATAPEFEAALAELTAEHGLRVVVDLREVAFMDSTGLRALVMSHQGARRDGVDLSIVRGPDALARLFEISGLAGHLPLVDAPPQGSP